MTRSVAVMLGLSLLAACAAPEPAKAPEPTEAPEPAPVEAEPEPAPSPEPPKPVLTGPAAKEAAQKLLRQAFESLNDGNEDKAKSELDQAREYDSGNKQIACLLKGITADPVAALGRESTGHTVAPGETLGAIAQRALGDVCEFYLLARYNQIKVPKHLAAGQVIRIPGKVALAPPVAPPSPRPAAVEPLPQKKSVPDEAAKSAAALAAKKKLIEGHHRAAQAAFRRQDLSTAIREWDKVLELDPSNELAKARREEAVDLSRRLKQIK